ncbi:RING finger and WD repeat domain-containing protein 3 [Coemansia sp. RSA 2711]|nr:RING finger and WD repeat domain-containing protein 3 [Coemansia sp. RSA 2711]
MSVDAELSQSASPPSLTQVFAGPAPQPPLRRNGSALSADSAQTEEISDSDQPDGVAAKRPRIQDGESVRGESAASAALAAEAPRRPAIAHERQSRFFASSDSMAADDDSDSDDFAQPPRPAGLAPRMIGLPPLPGHAGSIEPVEPAARSTEPTEPAAKSTEPAEPAEPAADDRNACSVCLEAWTISGAHRVVSLKCGHLFGQSCARKWLRRSSQRQAKKIVGKCPECNQRAEWRDIRPIYARSITAVDSSRLDALDAEARRLAQAKALLDGEHTALLLRYSSMYNEVARLRRELEQAHARCQVLQMENGALRRRQPEPGGPDGSDSVLLDEPSTEPPAEPDAPPLLRLRATVPMATQAQASSRLLAVHPHEPVVYASYSNAPPRLHTLVQLDVHGGGPGVVLDLPHKQGIRGAEVSPHRTGPRYLLTASLDQTAVVSALGAAPAAYSPAPTRRSSPMVAARLSVNAPCWSCAWDARSPSLCYVGTAQGRVLAFDLRRPDAPVHTWDALRDGIDAADGLAPRALAAVPPVHSIVATADARLVVANSNGVFALPACDSELRAWTPLAPAAGAAPRSCYSLAYDRELHCLAASFRVDAAGAQTTEHMLYDAGPDLRRRRACIAVPSPQSRMARTSVFSYARGARRQGLFCAGVEATRMVRAWDAAKDGAHVLELGGISAAEDIVDVRGWQWDATPPMFASLTNSTVRLYDIH